MKRCVTCAVVLAVVLVGGAAPAFAQSKPSSAAPADWLRAEFLKSWDDTEKKFVDLAQAVPQEKYTWRPGKGVRSVSEVFLHVAGANYLFMSALGAQSPAEITKDSFETSTTDRAKVVEYLKQSFEHVRQTVQKTSDADLEKPAKLFGRDTTVRGVLWLLATHLPEHLGQSIAYARMNNVVPPWTVARQAKQQQQKPKK